MLHATTTGSIYVRLPEIQAGLGISEGLYGLVLLAMPMGVLSGSLTVPKRIEKFGSPRVIGFGLAVATALQIAVALSPGAAGMALLLYLFGFAFAGANVGINVEANRFEAETGAKIMTRCHGWWAVGFLVSSFAAAWMVRLDVTPLLQFTAHTVLMLALVAALVLPMPQVPAAAGAAPARRFAVPGRAVLLVGAWALAGILMEGTTRGWIVIYVRDTFGAAEAVAAMALPTIVLTQTVARFVADGAIVRFGLVAVARASALALGLGILTIVIAPTVPVALLGCLMIGLGIAIYMPQGFAAAGRQNDRPPAESVAAFASMSTLIGFVGPPLFGGLGQSVGLQVAFALVLPLVVLSFFCAPLLAEREAKAD